MAKEEVTFTKYEEARIIGSRALQLAMGAPPLLDLVKLTKQQNKYFTPVDLAKLEFQNKIIPMHVVRKSY